MIKCHLHCELPNLVSLSIELNSFKCFACVFAWQINGIRTGNGNGVQVFPLSLTDLYFFIFFPLAENQEQFYLYLIISVTAGVLLCLMLVIGRLTLQRRGGRKKRGSSVSGSAGAGKGFGETQLDGAGSIGTAAGEGRGGGGGGGTGTGAGGNFQQLATGETHLADSFNDDISDIDVDVDLTHPMPLSSLSSRNEVSLDCDCLKWTYVGKPRQL